MKTGCPVVGVAVRRLLVSASASSFFAVYLTRKSSIGKRICLFTSLHKYQVIDPINWFN